uniref:Uncharacterized protein n=1 Tax=Panagrolaimus superbus TaxID=310955 RepID=A0A914YA89_9BILA
MAHFGTLIIATFSVLTLLSIYVTAGPIGDRSITTTTTNVVEDTTTTALATTNKGETLSNETGIIDTLTTDNIDIVGGNETHVRQKRSCGCCCCRPCCCCCRPPCCCGCGGCGCCGCGGGGRKRRAIQELSHKLMNKKCCRICSTTI